tara:strand:- start:1704 stop:1880 length:177 start_codon:yes stop_codon:yes gene_type:complete
MDLYQKVERVIKDHIIEHQAEVSKGQEMLKKLKPSNVRPLPPMSQSIDFPDYTELPDD